MGRTVTDAAHAFSFRASPVERGMTGRIPAARKLRSMGGKRKGSGPKLRLTTQQKEALAVLVARIESGERQIALRGYAGTGKTTLVRYLCQRLAKRGSLALAAPTNKAARVLSEKAGRPSGTIHSLLGLRMTRDFEGGYRLERTREPEDLPDLIVLDEASMVDTALMAHIEDAQSESDLVVLFVGDPAQLPPVNEESSPFDRIDGPEMTKIVRQQKGSPIVELATHIREHIEREGLKLPGASQFDEDLDSGVIVRGDVHSFLADAIKRFQSPEYARDANHCRILAWTNEQVRAFNETVRESILGPAAPEFTAGEWLVLDEAYRPTEEAAMLAVSTEVRIEKARLSDLDGYSVWMLDTDADVELRVISRESRPEFEADLGRRRKKARDAKGKQSTKAWEEFYRHRERYASVTYPFAQTVHKAQGSTFRTALVYLPDLRRNQRNRERNRLLYTAVTRPSHLLVLCR